MNVHASGHALARRGAEACDDAWAIRERGAMIVAALADGVSASREGGMAARRAVEMLADYCLVRPRAWSPRRALAEFTAQINRHLHAEAQERHGQPELACTLCAVVLEAGRLYGCNVGDSPVFLWRRGRLLPLAQAHALAQPGLEHVLTRAIGLAADVEPFFFEHELAEGDVVLLCSDGVTTALLGNCGVTFAPCRPQDKELLAGMMETVEDIPRHAILSGLPWSWEDYGGYLDAVDVGKIGAFERQLLSEIKAREPAILNAIRTDREIKPETENKLVAFLDAFAKTFA